jgi:cytochrome c biogenesis protein CcmG/thiol:disulfide interchange protein DsbE
MDGIRPSCPAAASRAVISTAVVTIALTMALRASAPRPAATDIKNAPDVTFLTETGLPVHVSELRGHIILVDFWATWCPPCKVSFPAVDALYREFHDKGLEVLAVNLDERSRDVEAFLHEHPHTMTVLLDPKGTTPPAFSVKGMPSSFLIDRAGTVRFTHMGYSNNVAAQYRREIMLLLSER